MITRLFKPVDIAPLVFFRIVGGGLITIELIGQALTNYHLTYIESDFHFSYLFFQWLKPWSPAGVYIHLGFNIMMGILVTLGLFYRASTILLFFGVSSLFLMEKAVYINHTYLYSLATLILIFVPAHRAMSLDRRRRPEIRISSVPAWTTYLLMFQIGVVYVFAGLAKLNADWLQALPMRIWLLRRSNYPLIGGLLEQEWLAYVMSYAGMGLDLFVVPGLLWKRTRKYAFGLAAVFHLTNVLIFGIGTFPWFSIAMTALFFPASSFRRLPFLKTNLPVFEPVDYHAAIPTVRKRITLAALTLYVIVQILIPSRQWMYPGPTSWTEEGHMFSWRMMLRSKRGYVNYVVRDTETGQRWKERPRDYLNYRQRNVMVGKPDMMLEFAHYLAEAYRARGHPNIEVSASSRVSLNGGPFQQMIDTTVDLVAQKRSLKHYDWVLPLQNASRR